MERRGSKVVGIEYPPNVKFARELLRAFAGAERFAREKGGIVTQTTSNGTDNSDSYPSISAASSFFVSTEKSRKQLVDLYIKCIGHSIDEICTLLRSGADTKEKDSRAKRVDEALRISNMRPDAAEEDISTHAIVQLLRDITYVFREQHGFSVRADDLSSEWKPEWRTQNLVWTLLKKLGSTDPPPGPLVQPYKRLKEAAFACLFKGDYLSDARRKCSFKHSLLQYIPIPGKWDADVSWIGTAVFISMPMASLVHSWDEGNRLAAFWGTFVIVFCCVSIALLLLFASYRSSYSNALLDRAARGTPYEREKIRLSMSNLLAHMPASPISSVSRGRKSAKQTISDDCASSTSQLDEENVEAPQPKDAGSMLRLYHASMFVERIYGSTYLDESWMLGMTEQQLLDAITLVLQTAGSLGRQTAAFSFTSLAIASRGLPDPELVTSRPISAAVQGSQVSFAIFSFLGGLAFTCGMMSAMLCDLITRQMAFTQVKNEGTAHAFVEKFGFFIRVTGGLNSCAGMSLFTGVMVFLLSIFRVHPAAVVPLGTAWLVLGSLLIESFFTKFHFWNMSEIFEDVGDVVDDPDLQSPSPIAGTLQRVMRWLRSITSRSKTDEKPN